ncbi:TIGR00295 family protein [Methanobacterium sp. BAmetb5]|uniref:TIGR00295 family protein n=1 Tax=Methanobacterium sp. BAmetb5 TaxID=2025351 RepID=UPI000E84422C|nr:TIGR00295 family protein [Methanobacterium sp. BAmetb5]AXV39627.1 MAG: TIGR00295 family protein [Methanobacterium sp. BAmetb5]
MILNESNPSQILQEFNCPPFVIAHSRAVLSRAIKMKMEFELEVDMELVKTGALLHDVGRSQTNGIKHAVVGAELLKERGFSREIVNIVERHIGAGISREEAKVLGIPPKDYMPLTLEEKLVAHADNLIHGTQEVDLEFVIKKWRNNLGENHPSIPKIIKLHSEITKIPVT